jgi:hypothetical protein
MKKMSEMKKHKKQILDWILNAPLTWDHEMWLQLEENERETYRIKRKEAMLNEITHEKMMELLKK